MSACPRRLLTVAGAVLSLLTACEEPVLLVVRVGLQGDSCGTGDVGQIALSCPATAGAWVSDREGGSLDQECVSIPGDQDLGGLRELYAGMDLNASPGEDVTVEVALFAGGAGEGCVQPGELPDRPEVIMSGTGRADDLSGSRGPVEVYLACTESPARTAAEACQRICLDAEDGCESGLATQACQQQRSLCQSECTDDCSQCTTSYEACLEESIEGSCQLAYERCLDAGEQIPNACNFNYHECVGDGCGAQRDVCFAACPSAGCGIFPTRR
jgi:hypothetical protein